MTNEANDRIQRLTRYFVDNQASLTHEALASEASRQGFSDAEIEAASAAAEARRAPDTAARGHARRVILGLYAVTYVVLAVGLLTSDGLYGLGSISVAVLTVMLGIVLAISLSWVRRRHLDAVPQGAMAALVAVPLVLLLGVAGLCVALTGPVLFRGV